MKKRELFKVEGDNVIRERKYCPKCGPGVFLAGHKNRSSCGKCGYTEFKGKNKIPEEQTQSFEEPKKDQPKKDEKKPAEATEEPKKEGEKPSDKLEDKPVEEKKESKEDDK